MKTHFSFNLFPTMHKFCEVSFQLLSDLCSWFEFSIRYREKCSHAGLYFTFSLLKFFFIEINIYDERHWNYEAGRWNTYNEQYDISICYDYGRICDIRKLDKKFSRAEADKLLTELIQLSPKIDAVFSKYDHKYVNEFYQEVSTSTRELEDWLRAILRKKHE